MKKIIILLVVFCASQALAERIVVYDTTSSAVVSSFWGDPIVSQNRERGAVKVLSFDEFDSNLNTILDLLNREIPIRYWLIEADTVREMTQIEKDSVDFAIANTDTLNIRQSAKQQFDGFSQVGLYERAKLKVLLNEINILRNKHSLADRTLMQFKTAIKNEVDSKNVDVSSKVSAKPPSCGGSLFLPMFLGVWLWLKKRFL